MPKTAQLVVVSDGTKTRFEERELELATVEGVAPGGVFEAAALGEGSVALIRFAAGFDCEFHNTDAPTYMFIMQGEMEIELSDGVKRVLRGGDHVYMTDNDGEGHRSRVLGDEAVIMATAGYAP
jgi:hypothetical protein